MFVKLFKNPVGRKLIMAVTGLGMIGFVVVHLLGNLSLFLGPDGINLYAAKLHSLGPLLWVFRLGMVALLGFHVVFGVWLTLENRRAKPEGYAVRKRQASTLSSETMIYSGLLLLTFILFHLLHFTLGVIFPALSNLIDAAGRNDVFTMVTQSFHKAGVVLIYVAAMAVLFFHIGHGLESLVQTIGLNNEKTLPLFGKLSPAAAVVLALGYVSIPALVIFGLFPG
jgi:succinate dehydrogenase / fumarate reductase cytochrome b subunit